MWRSEGRMVQYIGIDVRLILPHIEYISIRPFDYGIVVYNGTARGIDNGGVVAHYIQEPCR